MTCGRFKKSIPKLLSACKIELARQARSRSHSIIAYQNQFEAKKLKPPVTRPIHVNEWANDWKAYGVMTEALAIGTREYTSIDEQSSTRAGADPIAAQAVRAQLDRILNSRAFARSPRISRFLTFVVEQTLQGQEDKLKEYLLGVEVFGRMESFDPRIDSIVRVEARRLRYKLEKYYETEGRDDAVFIQLRKGCYVPIFTKKANDRDAFNADSADVPHVRAIEHPHAFALYAKARWNLARWTPESIAESVSCLSQALDEAPDCASAHAALASAWLMSGMLGFMPARDVIPRAKASARQALSVQPDCAEGQAVLGFASGVYDWEWQEADFKLRRAIQSNPCDIPSRVWYSLYLTFAGRPEDAVREARRAQQASPTTLSTHLAAGLACHAAGAYEEALLQYRLAQDLDGSSWAPPLAAGILLTDQQMYEQAAQTLQRARQASPSNPAVLAALAYNHASAGRKQEAIRCASDLADMAARQYVPPLLQAMTACANGDREMAFRKLDEAVEERSVWLPLLQFAAAFDNIREDERYLRLLERTGLRPAAARQA
jgi:tetratricopeptide (TPR) repeat protein